MFRRILFSTAAAAALLAAAPALAADQGEAKRDPCSCCSDGSIHQTDHALREQERRSRAAQPPAGSDDPFVRNQSFGG